MSPQSIGTYLENGKKPINKFFTFVVFLIVTVGLLAFFSASFGLLGRGSGPTFENIVRGQIFYGILPGIVLMIVMMNLKYILWRKMAFLAFIFAVGLNLLLLVPSLAIEHGGATRWLNIFGVFSFQPSELLKICFIIYLASWLSNAKDNLEDYKFGLIPFLIILGTTIGILIFQKDTDTSFIVFVTSLAMLFVGGGRMRDIFVIILIASIGFLSLLFVRPYLMERVKTFLNPDQNTASSGYQINQSLVAIGSGGLLGNGFGQSVQKYSRLPEPIGDSIFAVIGEEFGFLGASTLIILFIIFLMQGIKISIKSHDSFGRLLSLGIVIMITAQSFMNIASMLGIVPISGLPLVFISQGGSSMMMSLMAIGIMFNISRYSK
jgi:cell division protein FtsW